MKPQIYEDYWQFTSAYTDYNGENFISTLKICLDYIDVHKTEQYSPELYSGLQNEIKQKTGIAYESVRKAINQFVKFGFVEPYLNGYHTNAKEYVSALTNRKRQSLLSKIIYSNSGFQKSVHCDDDRRHINFFIKTLEECGSVSKDQLAGLMITDVSQYPKGFLTQTELLQQEKLAKSIDFISRKYNQVYHLCNLLSKLDNICFKDNIVFYFDEDAKRLFGEDYLSSQIRKRDPYLHRLYKNQLEEESQRIFGDEERCMLEQLPYPVLIASHIKPFIDCNDDEAYDPNNGLLLSKTIDALFDLKYVSFADDGRLMFYSRVHKDIIEAWKEYRIDNRFLTEERKRYLGIHRNICALKNDGSEPYVYIQQ